MEERLFNVLYHDCIDGERTDVVAREMTGAIKSRYLEKGGALNELDNISNRDFGFTGYEAVVEANSPREAIDIFWKLMKEFEGGGDTT